MLYSYSISGFLRVEDIHPTGHMKVFKKGKSVEFEGTAEAENVNSLRACLRHKYKLLREWLIIWPVKQENKD